MSDETEKSGYPQPCPDGPGIDTNICVDGKLAHTVKLTGQGADLLQQAARGPKTVNLGRTATTSTADQALWAAIRNRTDAIAFDRYFDFIDRLLCTGTDVGTPACEGEPCEDSAFSSNQTTNGNTNGFGAPSIRDRRDALARQPSIYGIDAYQLLKVATQAFLLFEAGVVIKERNLATGEIVVHGCDEEIPDESSRSGRAITFQELEDYLRTSIGNIEVRGLPYLGRIVNALAGLGGIVQVVDRKVKVFETLPYCNMIMQHRFNCPSMLELIWSYWHEEGMLVQTINAIAFRFKTGVVAPVIR